MQLSVQRYDPARSCTRSGLLSLWDGHEHSGCGSNGRRDVLLFDTFGDMSLLSYGDQNPKIFPIVRFVDITVDITILGRHAPS